jgi:hypothetical protein
VASDIFFPTIAFNVFVLFCFFFILFFFCYQRADSHDGGDIQQLMEEKQKLQDQVEEVRSEQCGWE